MDEVSVSVVDPGDHVAWTVRYACHGTLEAHVPCRQGPGCGPVLIALFFWCNEALVRMWLERSGLKKEKG